jgi:hypothetical protein
MRMVNGVVLSCALLALCGPATAVAQTRPELRSKLPPSTSRTLASSTAASAGRAAGLANAMAAADAGEEAILVFDREVFFYPGSGRRDPFAPLVGDQGIRFEDLTLNGIIHSPTPRESVALIGDRAGKIHRLRFGDRIGNARVLEITVDRVLFAVTSFGISRQEQLDLKRKDLEGADR